MDTRQEFEEWYEAESMPAESDWFLMDDGEYEHEHTHGAWMAWQRQQQTITEQAAMINELREAVQSADIIICGLGIHHAGERQLAQDGVLMLREMLGKTSPQVLTAHDNAVRVEAIEECAVFIENGRFLHEQSPGAMLAKEAAKGLRNMGRKYEEKGDG